MIKTIVIIILIGAAGLLLYNYMQTGEFSFRLRKLTQDEQELSRLEKQLAEVKKELASLERASRATGLIAPQAVAGDLDALLARKAELEQKIAELKERIRGE